MANTENEQKTTATTKNTWVIVIPQEKKTKAVEQNKHRKL